MPSRKLFNQTLHLDRVKMRSLIKKKKLILFLVETVACFSLCCITSFFKSTLSILEAEKTKK